MKKSAVIYARYSSESQTEQSIEGQLRVCEEYAERNGYVIVNTYIDRAMTGTNDNRYDFQRMLKDSNKREWQVILVYKLDRFARNRFESVINRKKLADNGVDLVSAMENIPDTPEGKLFMSIIEGYNEYFSEDLRQKVKRGMRETRKKGLYQGGGVPFGYKVIDRKLVIDEKNAETVRFIFEQYALGVYVKDIISSLTSKGILRNGKPFAVNTVYGILANEKYSGKYYHEDEIIENMYPKIVPDNVFSKVKAKVDKNKFGKRSITVRYLLRHKLKCGYCGKPMSAETGTTKKKTVKHYYKCIGRKKYHNGCESMALRKEFLEELIIENIIETLSKPKTIDTIVKGILKLQNNDSEHNKRLNILLAEKKKAEKSITNLLVAIEDGVYTKSTQSRLHELECLQDDLDKQILIERNKKAITVNESEIRAYYSKALSLEPQLMIDMLVKEIIVFNDKIEIHYNSPMLSPDESRGFSFTHKTAYMKYIIQNKNSLSQRKIQITMYIH